MTLGKQKKTSFDNPTIDRRKMKGEPSTESRNPLSSGRRLRDRTPKRTRDASSKQVAVKTRNATPSRSGPPSLTGGSKKKGKIPAKMSTRALKNRRDNTPTRHRRDTTPSRIRNPSPATSTSRTTAPSRAPQKASSRKASASPLGAKLPTAPAAKARDKSPKKAAKGGRMSRFMKGGKKSKLPTDLSSPRGSDEENSLEEMIHVPPVVEEKSKPEMSYPTPAPPAEEVQRTRKKETKKETKKEAKKEAKKETKKKTQQNESPQRSRQRNNTADDAFVVDESKCGGSSILKSADDVVLGVGYYFGNGIVAIVDGIKGSNCAQGEIHPTLESL